MHKQYRRKIVQIDEEAFYLRRIDERAAEKNKLGDASMNSYIGKKSSANTGKHLLFQRLSEFIDNDAMHWGSLAIEKKKKPW